MPNARGLATYDISDIKASRIILWTFENPSLFSGLIRLGFYGAIYTAPLLSRKILGITPVRIPHSLAMLACAYLELARLAPNPMWVERAERLLRRTAEDATKETTGESWGFPFPWFTYEGTMAANTGTAHGTMWAANGFYDLYLATHSEWALGHACLACDFLVHGLNSTEHESGSLAKSYTKFDQSQCINVNADAASILIRLGNHIHRREYAENGARMLRFVLESQSPDGSWPYDLPMPGRPWSPGIDGFHTGMVLRAIAETAPEIAAYPEIQSRCGNALRAGIQFYISRLFKQDGQPLYAIGKTYPVDPYSCAQAILTLADSCACGYLPPELREQAESLLHKVFDRTVKLMMEPDGSFLTARYRLRKMRLRSLRWGQAVLCFAFFRYGRFLLTQSNRDAAPGDLPVNQVNRI